jgi:glycosyltransferase involved in cell wall biosynthesis
MTTAPGRPFRHSRFPVYSLRVNLSVILITYNEQSNLARALESVQPLVRDGAGEIIVVDSGSTDRTLEIAKSFDAKVFVEAWKGYAAQKNSALEKATGDWILSLDADEEVSPELAAHIERAASKLDYGAFEWNRAPALDARFEDLRTEVRPLPLAFWVARKNYFLGRWLKHGGLYPDRKLRLFTRGGTRFDEKRVVHEDAHTHHRTAVIRTGCLIHHCYPTLSDYIDHMNRYSSLGAEMVVAGRRTGFSMINIVIRPWFTFFYNYFLRLGFLDGREGLLLHLYHAVYVSWKYAKAWELERSRKS